MDKRSFIGTLAAAAATPAIPAFAAPAAARGPAILTVTGALPKGNRGKLDPVADQMMLKHKVSFDKAWAFDFAALTALPATTIRPVLEYDGKPHTLAGPLLTDVLKAAGVSVTDGTRITLRAVDGYAAALGGADTRTRRFIVATHMDGAPMALGGLGPLWALYDPGQVPELAARPVKERFGGCPWALYHIDVA